jgi:hypothetical protein
MTVLSKDIKVYDRFDTNPFYITIQEVEDIINANEEEDIVAIEEDLKVLIDQKKSIEGELYCSVQSINPFHVFIGNGDQPE